MLRHVRLLTFASAVLTISATQLIAFQNLAGTPEIGFVAVAPSIGGVQGSLELRAIVGTPGAAVVSESIALPSSITGLWIAPRQSYALVAQGTEVPTSMLAISGLTAKKAHAIAGALAQPDSVAFGPLGESAVLYSRASGRVQVITGLPSAPHLSRDFIVDTSFRFESLAISDDGSELLAAAEDNSIYLLTSSGTAVLLYSSGRVSGLTFLARKPDAAFLDTSEGRVVTLRDVAGSSTPFVLPCQVPGLQGGLSVVSADSGNVIIVSNPTAKQIVTIDLTSFQVQFTSTPRAATILQAMQHSNEFLLSATAGQSAWLFEYSPEKPRVYFAPSSGRPRQ